MKKERKWLSIDFLPEYYNSHCIVIYYVCESCSTEFSIIRIAKSCVSLSICVWICNWISVSEPISQFNNTTIAHAVNENAIDFDLYINYTSKAQYPII